MANKTDDFQSIKLSLASPDQMLNWSHGEVIKPETINYRTQKAEKDGLFSESIFGPEKDWECYCGKYRRIRFKGIVCDKCGVEVTRSIVRRERMGHIKLATPVSHIWFLRGVPSRIGLLLDMSILELERVIYFTSYIVTNIDEEARERSLKEIDREYKLKTKNSNSIKPGSKKISATDRKKALKVARDRAVDELKKLRKHQVLSELKYMELSRKFGEVFEASMGGEAIRKILEGLDLEEMKKKLEQDIKKVTSAQRIKLQKRLKLIKSLINANIRPEWMFITILPVIPPDLRPMVQLDGGRYATSDVNDLYRRVINRNNRLKKLMDINAPEVIMRNEKRMLQEAVDALIDNSARRGQAVTASTGQKRVLKSLADMLKGKQGRFRQNLLGKRVDYSGRSVIVVGPQLKLHECGLPKRMALEIFKPFVINRLIDRGIAYNIRGAGKLIEDEIDEVWESLEEVIADRYVLLNRAPTLHRLGIQAFKPVLIEGSAIQIHPLVCQAFNADFDGDQMAVHLPLSKNAQKEAKNIMLSRTNLLKPATGDPIINPTQDIVLGCFWLTRLHDKAKGEGKIFSSFEEAKLAYDSDDVDLHAKIRVMYAKSKKAKGKIIQTSVGRIFFNDILPPKTEFVNREMNKKSLVEVIAHIIEDLGEDKAVSTIDEIKNLGFHYSTVSGISLGFNDLRVPSQKNEIIKEAEKKVDIIYRQYQEGLLTASERKSLIEEVWLNVQDEVAKEIRKNLNKYDPVYTIVDSGSKGSWGQTTQMIGLKGLVVNPSSEIIELPIKNSFMEGLTPLEFFIATHGARKGTTDTALKTAAAGYLTRRLVDVSQDIVIKAKDCKDDRGIIIYREDGLEFGKGLSSRIRGRVLLQDIKVKDPKGKTTVFKKGEIIDKKMALAIDETGIKEINVRSVVNCRTQHGICQTCYGWDLGNNRPVELGEAVGIVTAQAIGEPGTQLTMRTFHTGGVAGSGDITMGLPRVEEIFEVRTPKGKAVISDVRGVVEDVVNEGKQKVIKIAVENDKSGIKSKKKEKKEYIVPGKLAVLVEKGDLITEGQQICEGHIDLRELYKTAGKKAVERYIIKEVQGIYTAQGASIDDKHIEIIIKQMFSRIRVDDPGDTLLLAGDIVEKVRFHEENEEALSKGKKPATGEQIILGITKVSLTTDSFLSAASFMQTSHALINASVEGRKDYLRGLKENVIIGRLIPAGTGFRK